MNNENGDLADMFFALARQWELADWQVCQLLNIPTLGTLERFRSVKPSDGSLRGRILQLLEIYGYLRSIFPGQSDLSNGWMVASNLAFNDTPLNYMLNNGDAGVNKVLGYLRDKCYA